MIKKRILCMSDSSRLHTGFARVTREIFRHLKKTGKYEILQIGWFDQRTDEDVSYPIHQTMKDSNGGFLQEDKYARITFPKVVNEFKPDLVWTLGDEWMIDHVASAPNRNTFKWVGYFPIDGEPIPSKWGPVIENMDIAVAYGEYGKRIAKHRASRANIIQIPHGVDVDKFYPKENIDKKNEKLELLGLADDKKVIGVVARNQPRKAFDKIFEAYFYVLNGMYVTCNTCKQKTVYRFNVVTKEFTLVYKCVHCGSVDLTLGVPRDDVILYLHAAPVDCGWDLIDLQKDFNLGGKVLINPGLRVGVGVSDELLAMIYNTFDIFTIPTRGEGFGLPILEAMACGIPVVVTDYSAYTEWAGNSGILVPPIAFDAEPLSNIRRAIIDINLYVSALIKAIDNDEARIEWKKNGVKKAQEMDWKIIVKRWESLIDNILYPDGVQKPTDISNIEYKLEEM